MLAICPFCRARQEVPDPTPAAGVTCIGCHRRFAARRAAVQPAAAQPAAEPVEAAILRIERPHGVFDRPAVVARRVAVVATAAAAWTWA